MRQRPWRLQAQEPTNIPKRQVKPGGGLMSFVLQTQTKRKTSIKLRNVIS